MYDVHIESGDFHGKKLVQQHMMVNKASTKSVHLIVRESNP